MDLRLTCGARQAAGALAAAMLCLSLPVAAQESKPTARTTVRDTRGTTITVPRPDRPALLLFLRADQDQSLRTIDNVRKALEDLPAVQVLVILSGKQSPEEVKRFSAKFTWPLVTDPEYKLVGRFVVRVWPISLVILPDGRELTRMSGLPQSYVRDLNAYLAFATRKIDRKTLDARLAAGNVIVDTPRQMADRHLRVAQRLLEKDLAEQARREIEKGLKLQPAEPRLMLAKARAFLVLRRPAEALGVLGRLDEKSALVSKIAVLKGGALVALGKWDNAIGVLEAAVKLNPNPSEAYYFLGVAYQRKARWPEAAKAFRAAFEATPAGRPISVRPQTPTTQPAARPQPAETPPTTSRRASGP